MLSLADERKPEGKTWVLVKKGDGSFFFNFLGKSIVYFQRNEIDLSGRSDSI